jgi:hypothetical protein
MISCAEVANIALGPPAKTWRAELFWRCPGPAHAHGDRRPSLRVNSDKNVWHCFACDLGGSGWELAAFLGGLNPEDKPAVASWLRNRGLLPHNDHRFSAAEFRQAKRERERLERAAEKLAAEERRLRIAYADEVRTLERLEQRTANRLCELGDGHEADEAARLLAVLPDHARRALAAYNVVAFAPVADRARFVLQPAVREEMIQAARLYGVQTADGAIVEVTL